MVSRLPALIGDGVMSNDNCKFPSGRSVANCRKDAKRLSRDNKIPLNQALDAVAIANGISLPWHVALQQLNGNSAQTSKMTVKDIQRVIDRVPELTHFGLGVYKGANIIFRNPDDYRAKLKEGHQELLLALDECNLVCRFLAHTTRRQTMNPRVTSYGLKHQVEGYLRRMSDVEVPYVSNGAFICAALHMGYDYEPHRPGSPNAILNISQRSPVLAWRKLVDRRSFLTIRNKDKLQELASQIGVEFA